MCFQCEILQNDVPRARGGLLHGGINGVAQGGEFDIHR